MDEFESCAEASTSEEPGAVIPPAGIRAGGCRATGSPTAMALPAKSISLKGIVVSEQECNCLNEPMNFSQYSKCGPTVQLGPRSCRFDRQIIEHLKGCDNRQWCSTVVTVTTSDTDTASASRCGR